MTTEAESGTDRASLMYNLRTSLEVVLVCFACALVLAAVFGLMVGMDRAASFFGIWTIDLSGLLVPLLWVLPFAMPFYYGYRRKRHLGFAFTAFGYAVFAIIVGSAFSALDYPRSPHPQPHHASHISPFLAWAMWLGVWALWVFVPALCTTWGQSWRMRRRSLNSQP